MKTQNRSPIFIAATLLSALTLNAHAETFDVKLGLWELTHTTKMQGMPPIPPQVLAQMPPERRAQLEQQIKQSADPRTKTSKSCYTEKDRDRLFMPEDEASCTRKVISQTKTKLEVAVACTGKEQTNTHFTVEAIDAKHVTGAMNMTAMHDGNPMTVQGSFTGKWLGVECGKEGNE